MTTRYTYVCEDCCHGWEFESEVDPAILSDLSTRCSMCGRAGKERGRYLVTSVPRPTRPALPAHEGEGGVQTPPEADD